jgi:hypothetical protein
VRSISVEPIRRTKALDLGLEAPLLSLEPRELGLARG